MRKRWMPQWTSRRSTRAALLAIGAMLSLSVVPGAQGTAAVAAESGPLPLPSYDAAAVANPSATTAAGEVTDSTRGEFSVSERGSANYSVPLRVVPGRGGFQPGLSLNYSSEAGDGQVGVGFSLGGLSKITRCAKNIGFDARSEGPRFDDDDRFCLDGLRLKAVVGIYGANHTEYRTVPDTQRRVFSLRPAGTGAEGPASFTVESPDGVKETFGTDGSTTYVQVGGNQVAVTWSVAQAVNRSGGLIRYNYQSRVGGGSEIERWLSSIEYGGLGKLDRRVVFGYETRPDPAFGFQYGIRREGLQRLRSVTMSIDAGGWKQARQYKLVYQNLGSTKVSKLERITECGAVDTECRRPTLFKWSLGGVGFDAGVEQLSPTQSLVPSTEDSQLVSADLNGDGRTDLAWPEEDGWRYLRAESVTNGPGRYLRHVTAGSTGANTKVTGYPFDFDLDGRVDLLPREPQNIDWRPWLSRDDLSAPLRARTSYFGGLTNGSTVDGRAHGGMFGDFDGDGYQDVLEYNQAQAGGFIWSWRHRSGLVGVLGTDPQNPEKLAFSAPIHLGPGGVLSGLSPRDVIVLDVDGDGRDEVVYRRSLQKAGVLDVARPSLPHPVAGAFHSDAFKLDMKVLDLNGDGLADVVTNGGSGGPDTKLYYWLNTGRGFADPQPMGVSLPVDGLPVSEVVDADGDGRHDLLIPKQALNSPNYDGMELVRPAFSAGGGLVFVKSATPIGFAQRSAAVLAVQGVRTVDANGDGLDDVVLVDNPDTNDDPTRLMLYTHAGSGSNAKPDLLTEIREGNQSPTGSTQPKPTVSVTYAPTTDAGVYKPGSCGQTQHVSCSRGDGDRYVVHRVMRDAGTDSLNQQTSSAYRYRDGRYDRMFREFLGFAEQSVTTSVPGRDGATIERSFFTNTTRQADPRLDERWVIRALPAGKQSLERTTLGWGKKLTPGGSFFHYVSMTQQRSYEFASMCCLTTWSPTQFDAQGRSPLRQSHRFVNVVDIYGNVTSESQKTGTGAMPDSTTSTTMVPDVDLGNWLVNRPKKITVTDQNTPFLGPPPPAQTRTEEFSYDAGHVRVKQQKTYGPSSSSGQVLAVDYGYDASGGVNRVRAEDMTTGKVRESTAVTDPLGFPHAVMNGAGQVSRIGYDPILGVPKVAVDINDLRTDVTYDTLGRVRKVRAPSGAEQTTAYGTEPVGGEILPKITVTDGSGAMRESVLDRFGRVKFDRFKGFDGKVRQSENTYEAAGNLTQHTDPVTVGSTAAITRTVTAYDDTGRIRHQRTPDNQITSWAYNGLETTQTDARGNVRISSVDQRGQTVRITDGAGSAKAASRIYSFGAFGTLLNSETEGVPASRSTFTYDDLGNVLTSTDAERGTTTIGHNAFGEPVRSTDALGRVTITDYDVLGRATTATTTTNGTVTSVRTNVYDGDGTPGTSRGQLISMELTDLTGGTNRTVKTGYTYDTLHRRESVASTILGAQTETLSASFEYDAFDRTTGVRYPKLPGQSAAVKVVYDYAASNGRLEKVRTLEPAGVAGVLWTARQTDDRDRLTTEESGDGVTTTTVFDQMNRATSITNRTNVTDAEPSAQLQAEHYTYDPVGNLRTRSRHNPAQPPVMETFTHDPLDRVSTATNSYQNPGQPQTIVLADKWDYDKLGNISTSKRRGTYTYDQNKPTQVTSITGGIFGGRSYGYDAIGRQTKRPNTAVAYNDFDLPSKMTNTTGGTTAEFLYDGSGQRVRKTTRNITTTYLPGLYERHTTATKTEHRLLVAGGGTGSATLRYTQPAGASVVLKNPTLYNHTDRLGSTSLVTSHNATTGYKAKVEENRSYDTYGLARNPDWRTSDAGYTTGIQPETLEQGFTGHEDDRELGLVNMKGRIYDPTLARFTTPDPNVDGANPSQAWNRYTYVGNNPHKYTDPTGYQICAGGILEFGCDGAGGNIFGSTPGGSGNPGRGVNYQIGRIHITHGRPAEAVADSSRPSLNREDGSDRAADATSSVRLSEPGTSHKVADGYWESGPVCDAAGNCTASYIGDEIAVVGPKLESPSLIDWAKFAYASLSTVLEVTPAYQGWRELSAPDIDPETGLEHLEAGVPAAGIVRMAVRFLAAESKYVARAEVKAAQRAAKAARQASKAEAKVAARGFSLKGRLKEAGLPIEGKIRYIAPKNYNPAQPLPRGPQNGYWDAFGNEWVRGPSRTKGQAFEWDVQLSSTGRSQLGPLTRDGTHANVSLDGRITHK
ncbi:polymorphic toxin type 17 domain-containing protein [Kribbella sp. CA-294648]|uniref:polymorphic toxin type 17 domain-containing protein n=1 Tax=Kribbella sp. CA-294648 TaxID=3239948 RepID=UPI003D8CFB57